MKNSFVKSLWTISSAMLCVSCVLEFNEINPAYSPDNEEGDVKSVEFVIPDFVEEDNEALTKTALTSGGFVWAEKDTVGIFPSKGSQIYYEMSSGAGSSSAVFDGGGWALKNEHVYSSYYPFSGNIYLKNTAIPVTYSCEVTQVGNNNSDHLGANAFMFAPQTSVSSGKVTFKYWQLGSVLKPRVTLPAGTYTKLVLSTEDPIFVVKGTYDLTTGIDASSPSATMPEFVPVVNTDTGGLTNTLTINLENVIFSAETELITYIMAAPVDVSNIPITVTIFTGDTPCFRYEYVRTSSFVAQTNHNIRPNEKGLAAVANSSEGANAAFAAGETSLSLIGVSENSSFDLVLPSTSEPVSISMAADEPACTLNVSYPEGSTIPATLEIKASNGSNMAINTPESTVTLNGERTYESVRAATASNTLIVGEQVSVGTLYLEKGNVDIYGEIMTLNTDDLEAGEKPTVTVYGTVGSIVGEENVIVVSDISSIHLDKASASLKLGSSMNLLAFWTPSYVSDVQVEWSSSDPSIATVTSSGNVQGNSAGDAVITATVGSLSASCSISVFDFIEDYEAVDLGLSVKWGNKNLGADHSWDYGDYYAWGETLPKTDFSLSNYKFSGTQSTYFTKYCCYSGHGIVDNLSTLELCDDAAFATLGGEWEMPTHAEIVELVQHTTQQWTTICGKNGYLFTSTVPGYEDKSIFIPASGCIVGNHLGCTQTHGWYWSSSLDTSDSSDRWVWRLKIDGSGVTANNAGVREDGDPIRPVLRSKSVQSVSLDKSTLSMWPYESSSLTPSFIPVDASNKNISWTSSDSSVATVSSDGSVTAVAPGSATITATSLDGGHTAECCVTVSALPPFCLNPNTAIVFEDSNVKSFCVSRWDTNKDGELSYLEAAAVRSVSGAFHGQTEFSSFNEFQYFIGVSSLSCNKDDYGTFEGCKNLTQVALPYSLTRIGDYAFSGCTSLSSLVVPYGVTYIGERAFSACSSIKSINIPSSVTIIDEYAFYNTTNLKSIICSGNPPTVTSSTFNNFPSGVTLYVPSDLQSAYSQSTWNSHFLSISDSVVDLGLSVCWSKMNLCSSSVSDIGAYFGWGEVSPKKTFSWLNYYLAEGFDVPTKYNDTDHKFQLETSEDAAAFAFGPKWRMPSLSEYNELFTNCTWSSTCIDGVDGFLAVSKKPGYTDQSIFFPATGCYWTSHPQLDNSNYGYYWANGYHGDDESHCAVLSSDFRELNSEMSRTKGQCIRAVYVP